MPLMSSDTDELPPQRRGRFRLLPIILFIIFGVGYYFMNQQVNPYTGRKQVIDISPEQEAALGMQSYEQVLADSRVVSSGPQVDLVKSVGQRIAAAADAPDFQWEFNVLQSEQANAFCLPGGKVAVYSGLLPIAQSADGLAVVMGHEIAHALSRHGAERLAHQKLAQFGTMAVGMAVGDMDRGQQNAIMRAFGIGSQVGVLLPFSRKHESEADYVGLLLMARACFNPEESIRFWERMEAAKQGGAPLELLSTHPSDDKRIAQLREWLPKAQEERAAHCR